MRTSTPERTPAARAEARERRSQVRGLLWLALLVIFGSILRFGFHRVFTTGWWRVW